jgi:putative hydrolase of the HAD superfamily
MRITTIVFDFGNVLGFFSHRKAAEQLAPYTKQSPEEIQAFLFGGPLEEDYESGRISTAALIDRMRTACGLHCDEEQFRAAFADMFTPNDAVCGLLPHLKPEYRLLLLSNTNELHAHQFRAQFAATLDHFDALVLSHEIGVRKPHPRVFAHCQELAGSRPAECVFIDDLPANVEGARACGWNGIVYRRDSDLAMQLAQYGVVWKDPEQGLSNRSRAKRLA